MVQSEKYQVAGLAVNVYTLHPLTHSNRPVIVLFFLHGRNGSASKIEEMPKVILESYHNADESGDKYDLVIVTFVVFDIVLDACHNTDDDLQDHRNHGSRLVDPKSNRSWSRNPEVSNERHA
jgi:hypothetical protein